jgi:hypothetical protein
VQDWQYAHINCLPEALLKSSALRKICKAVVKECGAHRLFKVKIGPDVGTPSVSAELEGHDIACLKDFKSWCAEVLLTHEQVDTPESCRLEFLEALWPVLLEELGHFKKCSFSSLLPVRPAPPEELNKGFLFDSRNFVVPPATWKQPGHDRCVQGAPLALSGFLSWGQANSRRGQSGSRRPVNN